MQWHIHNRSDRHQILIDNQSQIDSLYRRFTELISADDYPSVDDYIEAGGVIVAIAVDQGLFSIEEAASKIGYDEEFVTELANRIIINIHLRILRTRGFIS